MVLNKIQELEIEGHIIFKDIMTDPNNRDYHLQQTGRSTVPCLYIDDKPMFESADIMNWLESNQTQIRNT